MTTMVHPEGQGTLSPNLTRDGIASYLVLMKPLKGALEDTRASDNSSRLFSMESYVPDDVHLAYKTLLDFDIFMRDRVEKHHVEELTFKATSKIEMLLNEAMKAHIAILERQHAEQKSLAGALDELAELDNYAIEEGLSPPSPVARQLAKNVLIKLASELPRNYTISLWEDGDVVIYSTGAGRRVSVYCRADGGVAFYVNSPDGSDYEGHYQSGQDMPMDIIIDALQKIPA